MKKYACVFHLSLETAMEYRVDFFLSLISTVFPIILQFYLWTAIYSTPTEVNNGYTYEQIILYTLLAGMTAKLTASGFEHEINKDIKDGGLNKYIVRPVNYFTYRLSAFMGGKIPAACILSIIMVIMLIAVRSFMGFQLEFMRIILYIVTLVFAILLNFVIYFTIAMLGFWITEISKMFGTIQIVLLVISGGVFPLDVFGSGIQKLTQYLPFKYTAQFPVDILNGKLLWEEVLNGFQFQIGWIFIFLILSCYLWKAGLKRYVAVGG